MALTREYVLADTVHALETSERYERYKAAVQIQFPQAEYIAIVGSGNWRFSLNPEKLLNEYHPRSDIDIAVVSEVLFHETWDTMRELHRSRWYLLERDTRERLLRNGQNVYAGFACPTWLPVLGHPLRYGFKRALGKLSSPEVGYRDVKMYFFRNETEMIDYYRRGFVLARRSLAS